MDQKENKMGTVPIPKLLFQMALPAIIAMMVQALYNIVDSIFVSRLGEEALTALSLAFPIQLIIIAFFVGLGIGINSLVSRKLGAKDVESATNAAEHGFIIAGILYVIIAILAFMVPKAFFANFTDDPLVIEYGVQYITIVMLFAFGRIFAQAGISVMQGTGEMVKPMKATMIGAIGNMILDPILIFGWFGIPAMGIRGAAIATVAAQILSMLYVFHAIFRQKVSLQLNMKSFHYDSKMVRQIVAVGLPATIMQGLGSVMLTGLNLILASFSGSAVAVLGVYFKLQSFIFMPIFGLGQGTMPIIGYSFGANNRPRMMEAIRFALLTAVTIMVLGTIVFQFFPSSLLKMFNSSPAMMTIGVHAFRTISWIFPMAGISIVLSTSFQAMGKAHLSMVVSFIRQLVVLLPSAYFFGKYFGLDAVWYSFIVSEIVGLSTVLFLFRSVMKSQLSGWTESSETISVEVE
jgi:putative MATE family efflux protein